MEYVVAVLAFALGFAVAYLAGHRRSTDALVELVGLREQLKVSQDALEQQKRFLEGARQQLEGTFRSLAGDVLQNSNRQFLDQATERLGAVKHEVAGDLELRKQAIEGLLKPLGETLTKLNDRTAALETTRAEAYGKLDAHLKHLGTTTDELSRSSRALETALRGSSQARGRWGEVALRNIAEMAGMTANCDFIEQATGDDRSRPDMIVKLPDGGRIPMDAKVPLAAYLDGIAATDPSDRVACAKKHAADLWGHVQALEKRDYASSLDGRVDFTVLFLPSDAFLSAAFEQRPELIEEAIKCRVLIATPVTLVALLRTVGIYWRQQKIADNATAISAAAHEFLERIRVFQSHLEKVGRGLETALKAYNDGVGSYSSRVLPAGRRLEELHGTAELEQLSSLREVEGNVRIVPPGE